jgi:hypothetical protein
MNDFNPDAFLNTDVEGSNDTIELELPRAFYEAQVDSVNPRVIQPRDGGEQKLIVEVVWELDDEQVKSMFGRTLKAKQSLWIDTVGGPQGMMDTGKGKNVQLGKLREALRQNDPGKKWNWNMLIGQRASVMAFHEDVERKDETGSPTGEISRFYRVSQVQPL